ncbi:MAG: hypothetical protein ACUVQ6_04870 [Dissulfurimicrobium sp.]|uniref:hypothetical protein n=1 Tax=Dissulfurimicrobium sp. TaxID=2022436 RepID=UPI00404B00CC
MAGDLGGDIDKSIFPILGQGGGQTSKNCIRTSSATLWPQAGHNRLASLKKRYLAEYVTSARVPTVDLALLTGLV